MAAKLRRAIEEVCRREQALIDAQQAILLRTPWNHARPPCNSGGLTVRNGFKRVQTAILNGSLYSICDTER